MSGKPYYAHPQYPVYDASVTDRIALHTRRRLRTRLVQQREAGMLCRRRVARAGRVRAGVGQDGGRWSDTAMDAGTRGGRALAVGKNAAVVATDKEVLAVDLRDGKPLWTQPLPAPPIPWGVALGRDGQVLVSLENGTVLCSAQGK